MNTIVVTGTDTDVGKTVFAAALTVALGARYWKPVQAGLADGSDGATVTALGVPAGRVLPEAYRLATPCSPHRAAEIDGVAIDPARLALPKSHADAHSPVRPEPVEGRAESGRVRNPCFDRLSTNDGGVPLVVEGAGGVLVPVTRTLLYADLFAAWGAPVVLVARTGLGTINHSLLSIEALRTRGVPILGVAFVGEAVEDSEATIAAIGGVRRLGRLPRLPVLDAGTLAAAFADAFDMADFGVRNTPAKAGARFDKGL